jgi:hypothetical protein
MTEVEYIIFKELVANSERIATALETIARAVQEDPIKIQIVNPLGPISGRTLDSREETMKFDLWGRKWKGYAEEDPRLDEEFVMAAAEEAAKAEAEQAAWEEAQYEQERIESEEFLKSFLPNEGVPE